MSRPPSYLDPHSPSFDADKVPVEVLVKHLLAAKQSLSSMALVVRAHDLATLAREMYEECVILCAQTAFLRRGIDGQLRLLRKVRRQLGQTYDESKRQFKRLIRGLDDANARLEQTLALLRLTKVDPMFRPPGEEQKSLLDFIDEQKVEGLREGIKRSLDEMQDIEKSFDNDLLSFDRDLRVLNQTLATAPDCKSPSNSSAYTPMSHLLSALTQHSSTMAQHLSALNKHFDMCVKAVRATEGGAALARRRAAETDSSPGGGPMSISGVITEQDTRIPAEMLDPLDPQERAELVQVVMQDAPEVDEVVAEIQAILQQMEVDFGELKQQADRIRGTNRAVLAAFSVLEEVGARLPSYVEAEAEFTQRWAIERDVIVSQMEEMDELKLFYDSYARAYDSLMLEAERRRSVEEKIQATLRRARDTVDQLIENDRKMREAFKQEVGDVLPADLWVGMNDPLKRWELVPVEGPVSSGVGIADENQRTPVTPTPTPPMGLLGRTGSLRGRGTRR